MRDPGSAENTGAVDGEDLPPPTGRPERWASGLMIMALGAALALAVVRILTHHPFNDECLHVHKLFLMSDGLTPHRDFWCNYPVAGYVLTLPLVALLPTSAWSLFGLRFLMLGLLAGTLGLFAANGRRNAGHWVLGAAPATLVLVSPPLGRFLAEYSIDHFAMLAAVAAFVLFFTRPRPLRVGAAAALCLLSVALTPKYVLPLGFGMLAFFASALGTKGRRGASLIALLAGTAAAALITLALYGLGGTSIRLNLEYAHVFMARFKLAAAPAPVSLFSSTLWILVKNLPLLAVVVFGLAGWFRGMRSRLRERGLAPLGVLIGALASSFVTRTYMAQYILPVVLCLVAFAPFAARIPVAKPRWLPLVYSVVSLGALGFAIAGAAAEFRETPANVRDSTGIVAKRMGVRMEPPALETLAIKQRILDRVPRGECVVASPEMHPLFRRDLTFVTADERPSFGSLLAETDPARPRFAVDHLRRRLAERPPASICLTALEINYPPGWRKVLEEFLRENRDRYVPRPGYPESWLRADLAR